MALDPCLRRLMQQTIQVASQAAATNAYGDRTYNAPAPHVARVEPNRRALYDANGEVLDSDFVIYTPDRIGLSDRVWLPGDGTAASAARVPKRIYVGVDTDGLPSHYEVYV